jgi:hypothetical protein
VSRRLLYMHSQARCAATCLYVLQEVVQLYYTRLLEDTIGACPAGAALDLAMSSLGLTTSNVLSQTKVRCTPHQ